jgi:ketosteroid isomerase-like protein
LVTRIIHKAVRALLVHRIYGEYISLLINNPNIYLDMKHLGILTAFLVSTMFLACTNETTDPADTLNKEEISNQINKNWDDFILAFTNGDIEKMMSFMTDDLINMPSFNLTQDFEETKAMFQGMVDNFYFENNSYTQTEIFVYPDMAYQFGTIKMLLINKTSGDTVVNDNRSISVWKKMDDGSWKLYRWMGQD